HIPFGDNKHILQVLYPGLFPDAENEGGDSNDIAQDWIEGYPSLSDFEDGGEENLGGACSIFTLPAGDAYGRSISAGDVIIYRQYTDHTNLSAFGLINNVVPTEHNPGNVDLWIYTSGDPSSSEPNDCQIRLHNRFHVQNYPKFGENIVGVFVK